MPLYEYLNHHTGQIELHLRSVAQRDSVPPHLRRVAIPSGVGFSLAQPPSQSESTLRAFYKAEEKQGLAALEREGGFKAKELKEIWTDGYHPEERKGYDATKQRELDQQKAA